MTDIFTPSPFSPAGERNRAYGLSDFSDSARSEQFIKTPFVFSESALKIAGAQY